MEGTPVVEGTPMMEGLAVELQNVQVEVIAKILFCLFIWLI